MSKEIIIHKDRSVLEIAGDDRKKFLQGLITNDVNKATESNLIFTAMLNAQGRFLYDFFIFEKDEKLFIDCLDFRRDEILKKLNLYKLRSKVEIKKNDEFLVAQSLKPFGNFIDPRHKNLGSRIYIKKSEAENFTNCVESFYHFARIQNKIPESELDLTYEKSFILEFGFDNLNAIDYQKGCYVGQELTARTHYLGQIRKKLFHIILSQPSSLEQSSEDLVSLFSKSKTHEILDANASRMTSFLAEKNSEITCEGKSAGIILSHVLHENELHALALVRLPEDTEFDNFKNKLELEDKKIFIID